MTQDDETYSCPVCGSPGFLEPPWDANGCASFDICDSCGIQFGYNDARRDVQDRIWARWRELWLANGKKPLWPKPDFHDLVPDAPPYGVANERPYRK